ncbi:MAG: flagellar motor switch protein FliM [Candidatus Eisenbacteria bacterium]|nr:flagellar motor switch protein FliM [Candidatus Eisenbacteria bacterium]MCC7142732.1 flagellar motor switch protein FliM [Candidatus Eisenbacteria bacterium]
MANILSQDEVDALLGGLPTDDGDVDYSEPTKSLSSSKVMAYDFRRPNRVSKEQLRFLQTIHEVFAREYAASLSGYLRSMVDIEIISVDQLTYGEYVLSLPGTTSLYIFSMPPLEGQGVIEVNPALILSMIDRLFGGTGAQSDYSRDLTNIEAAVMSKLVQRALGAISTAWEGVVEAKPQLDNTEKNPQMLQLLPNSETVILISCELRMGKTNGVISLCYPFLTMETILPTLAGRGAFLGRGRRTVPEGPGWISRRISESQLEVVAQVGATHLTVGEFLHLQQGDVIRLPRRVEEPIDLLVGGLLKATARPGLRGVHRVVKLEDLNEDVATGEEGAAHVA